MSQELFFGSLGGWVSWGLYHSYPFIFLKKKRVAVIPFIFLKKKKKKKKMYVFLRAFSAKKYMYFLATTILDSFFLF